jgi:hypothetical protein
MAMARTVIVPSPCCRHLELFEVPARGSVLRRFSRAQALSKSSEAETAFSLRVSKNAKKAFFDVPFCC